MDRGRRAALLGGGGALSAWLASSGRARGDEEIGVAAQALGTPCQSVETTIGVETSPGHWNGTLRTTKPSAAGLSRVVVAAGARAAGDGGGGIFVWDAAATSGDDGGTVIAVAGTVTGRWRRVFSGALHLTWFGVDRRTNNQFDSAPALQAAIDALAAAGGGTLLVPAGDYALRNTIRIPRLGFSASTFGSGRGITIVGEGPASSKVTVDPPLGQPAFTFQATTPKHTAALRIARIFLRTYRDSPVLVHDSADAVNERLLYAVFEDVRFQSGQIAPDNFASTSSVVRLKNASFATFKNCVFVGGIRGLHLEGCEHSRVVQCTAHSTDDKLDRPPQCTVLQGVLVEGGAHNVFELARVEGLRLQAAPASIADASSAFVLSNTSHTTLVNATNEGQLTNHGIVLKNADDTLMIGCRASALGALLSTGAASMWIDGSSDGVEVLGGSFSLDQSGSDYVDNLRVDGGATAIRFRGVRSERATRPTSEHLNVAEGARGVDLELIANDQGQGSALLLRGSSMGPASLVATTLYAGATEQPVVAPDTSVVITDLRFGTSSSSPPSILGQKMLVHARPASTGSVRFAASPSLSLRRGEDFFQVAGGERAMIELVHDGATWREIARHEG